MVDNIASIKRTSQAIDNFSFDEDFLVKVTELAKRNQAGTALEFFNPATEEKQDDIIAALGVSISAVSTSISSSGDNTVVSITNTPKLYYVSLSADGGNSADVTATVKIGSSSKYKVSLKAGGIYARNIGASGKYVTGSVGEDIIVNLSAAQTVHVSVEYADQA